MKKIPKTKLCKMRRRRRRRRRRTYIVLIERNGITCRNCRSWCRRRKLKQLLGMRNHLTEPSSSHECI